MKKILGLFAMIVLIAFISVNANADTQYFNGELFDLMVSPSIYEAERFNVIKCYGDYVPAESWLIEDVLINGEVFQRAEIYDYQNDIKVADIISYYEMIGGNCFHRVELDDEVIYEVEDYFYGPDVKINKEINLNEKYGNYAEGFYINLVESDCFYNEPGSIISDYSIEDYVDMAFIDVRCKMVQENAKYKGSDVYFICDQENAKSLDYYKSLLTAEDPTSGDISNNIQIYASNYPESLDDLAIGTYSFSTLVSDKSGNTSTQDFLIEVLDVTGPSIIVRDIITEYDKKTSEAEILLYVFATDRNGVVNKKLVEDNYFDNKETIGDYYAKVSAEDSYGNIGYGIVNIKVVDTKKPVITIPKSIHIKPSDKPEIEEIKSYISVIDGYDGEITDYEPIDLDGYKNNPDKIGLYRFKIAIADSSSNQAEAEFEIFVSDDDYPVISAGEYVIVLDKGQKLDKEDILKVLERLTELDLKDAQLSSSYFDDENPKGEYQLMISLADGSIFYHTIKIPEINNADVEAFEAPIVEEAKESFNYALLIGIAGVIATLSALGIVIYRKRH